MDKSKKYLVTGGAGYLGKELVKRLIEQGYTRLVVMSRNEGELVKLKEIHPEIEIVTGDVSSKTSCWKACRGVSGIFHLAAYKHVGLAEENTRQCVLSNVHGSMNLLEISAELHPKPDFVIGISTDKAAQVKGVYGATKLLMERLFAEFEKANPETKYRLVRYGNVLYSTGSVLCKWKDRLASGDPLTITDREATRFYWTVEQAVNLIFDCLETAVDSRPHHFPMKSIKMGDLLDAMVKKYGGKRAPKIHEIGLQLGENLHEVISDDGKSSADAERYTPEEIAAVI